MSQWGRKQDGREGLSRVVEPPRPKSNYPCSAASQLKSEELSLPEGKVRVKLDHDGAILDVDEDDVEKVGRSFWQGRSQGGQACPLRWR